MENPVVVGNSNLILATTIFILTYTAIVTEKVNRAVVSLLAAALMVLLGVLTQEKAIEGIDFNTIGLLVGMMVIVGISQKTGMFQYVAIKSAKLVKGEPWGVLVMLSLVTAVFSAFLDNVTTVLLIIPVTILITDELKVNPYPFLVTQVFASNIGGTATLIGDPPNIIIGSAVGLTFMDFVWNVAPVIPIIMVVTLIPIRLIYGEQLRVSEEQKKRVMEFKAEEAIEDPRLLKKSLFILGLTISGFILQRQLELEPATIALFGAALLLLLSGEDFHSILEKVEWTTIFFFVGLFIVVHGIEEAGLITLLANKMLGFTGGDMTKTTILIIWLSAIASAIVDNIPFVVTMIPLIKDMGVAMGGGVDITPLWWALSLGACLGGNGTIIGASANVLVSGMSERAGYPIGFFRFMRLAFPLMIMSIVISTIYVYWRYL